MLPSLVTGRYQGDLPCTATADVPIRLHRVLSLENTNCLSILKQIVGKTIARNTEIIVNVKILLTGD